MSSCQVGVWTNLHGEEQRPESHIGQVIQLMAAWKMYVSLGNFQASVPAHPGIACGLSPRTWLCRMVYCIVGGRIFPGAS